MRKEVFSSISTLAASSGTNFGSVVITARPDADCGISSLARSRLYSLSMDGRNMFWIKRLMSVDFPVRTGPTTPM